MPAYSLHPGAILTDLGKHLTEADLDDVLLTDAAGDLVVPTFKSPEQGAATAAFAEAVSAASAMIGRAPASGPGRPSSPGSTRCADPCAPLTIWVR